MYIVLSYTAVDFTFNPILSFHTYGGPKVICNFHFNIFNDKIISIFSNKKCTQRLYKYNLENGIQLNKIIIKSN